MKNGTNQAILLTDLLDGEGPFARLADDFVAGCCTRCRAMVDDEFRLHGRAVLCAECCRVVVGA